MKSHTSSHHVLKSLAELSPELLEGEAVVHEKGKEQQTLALVQKNKQLTIQLAFPHIADNRGYRGWGINE